MGHRVNSIPRNKCGELVNILSNTVDTPHWILPPPDYPGPHSQPQGGTKLITGEIPHLIGVPKCVCGTYG